MNRNPTINDEVLEHELAGLTDPGAGTELWRAALRAERGGDGVEPKSAARFNALFNARPRTKGIMIAAGLALATLGTAALIIPNLGRARGFHAASLPAIESAPASELRYKSNGFVPSSEDLSVLGARAADQSGQPASVPGRASPAQETMDRLVIRKATMELKAKNVNAAYARISLMLNESAGEYIEDSRRSGQGAAETATLTLRVAASRLSKVMSDVRELGAVTNENMNGQDVTDQVIDLDARIRNEQGVEKEVLALLAKRTEAPLKEIMEFREELGRIREQIERLTAQRDRTVKLAGLSTLVVMLSPADAPAPPAQASGVFSMFGDRIAASWNAGLQGLAQSVAWWVEAIVRNLIGWLIMIAITFGAVGAFRRWRRSLATERAPGVSI